MYGQTGSYRNQKAFLCAEYPIPEKAIWFVTEGLRSKSDFAPSLVSSVI